MSFFDELKISLSERPFRPQGNKWASSVLIPLIKDSADGEIKIMLTQRALDLDRQPGDFCFPGGHSENGETLEETAIRETFEETGIEKKYINTIGNSDFVTNSFGIFIMPYVAFIDEEGIKSMNLSKAEVEKAVFIPLKFFLENEPDLYQIKMDRIFPEDFPFEKIFGGKNYNWSHPIEREYFYEYNGDVIWGLTAGMIKNFCDIIKNNNIKF